MHCGTKDVEKLVEQDDEIYETIDDNTPGEVEPEDPTDSDETNSEDNE